MTLSLIAANVAAWTFVQGFGAEAALVSSLCTLGLIPGDLLGTVAAGTRVPLGPEAVCVLDGSGRWSTLVSSMFLHGGLMHIIGNMWFLWIFGDNVEDAMGSVRFALFYLLCGLAAAAAQIVTDPSSAVPMIGASGAIGGVMGAYAVLYPRARVHMLLILGFYVTTVAVPAFLMLGYWFLIQILGGLPQLQEGGAGVAFWAHVGGFAAGLVLVFLFRRPALLAAHLARPSRQTARYRI